MNTDFSIKELNDVLNQISDPQPYTITYYEATEDYVKRFSSDFPGENYSRYTFGAVRDQNDQPKVALVKTYYPGDADYNEDYYWGQFEDFDYEGGDTPLGHFTMLDSGNLGDGHEAWSLVRHDDSGRLFMKTGWYSSWGESGWDDDYFEVEPAHVTVIRYKRLGDPDNKAFDNPAVTV